MTHKAYRIDPPSDVIDGSEQASEPHFGDLRKRAYLRRLAAYRQQTQTRAALRASLSQTTPKGKEPQG
jgi:hypothetical protein